MPSPLALALALSVTPAALRPVPPLTGPVVDQARMLPEAGVERLESLARAARAVKGGNGVQLQYLLIPALGDEPIEDFSIRVAEAWKIGTKGQDNGLLFVVSQADRKFRIEVGGGLEGDLTDIQTKGILDGTLTPAFRRGDYAGGLYRAGAEALTAVHGLPAGVQSYSRPDNLNLPGLLILFLFFLRHGGWLILILFYLYMRYVPYRRYSYWGYNSGGFWGGGSGGGSSSGGGGSWSGGGGGFSGGGASGGW